MAWFKTIPKKTGNERNKTSDIALLSGDMYPTERRITKKNLEPGTRVPTMGYEEAVRTARINPVECSPVFIEAMNEKIVMTDYTEAIRIYESNGKRCESIHAESTKSMLCGIAVNENVNSLFVCDAISGREARVQIFNITDDDITPVVYLGQGLFGAPHGICVTKDHKIIVTDVEKKEVYIIQEDGYNAVCFGEKGKRPGQFLFPHDVVFDEEHKRIIVSDTINQRLQVFSSDGQFIQVIEFDEKGNRLFDYPTGLKIDPLGNLLVVQNGGDALWVIDGDLRPYHKLSTTSMGLLKDDNSPKSLSKKRVKLAIGVLSKLSAINRRIAIRATWFQVCKDQVDVVVCKFFTDQIEEGKNKSNSSYIEEKSISDDILYMPFKGGYNFALRLLWMLQYFETNFEFDFFLRVDDDYFVCLDHLIYELSSRPIKQLYWGYIHCTKGVVRVDEGFMILTHDIIREALQKRNSSLMCSPFGDQAVAMWIADSRLNITYFSDNLRVVHASTGYRSKEYLVSGLCEKYIGLHGSYPKYMLKYWKLMGKREKTKSYVVPEIKSFSDVCSLSKKFDYRMFWPEYRFDPKPCKNNPSWTNRTFIGREELGHEQIF